MANHPSRGRGPFTLTAIPLSVLNRALDLFNVDREKTATAAWTALLSAEQGKDIAGLYTPLAQAIAEYMSLTGPWSEEDGEYAGENGYQVELR